jgi:hypothetical protein
MPKQDANRRYVNKAIEDAILPITGLAANTLLGNPTADAANAQSFTVSASRLIGRGASGNIANISLGTGLAFSGTSIISNNLQLEAYTSPQQTITAGGTLTIAHGLSARPQLIQAELVCLSDNLGYTAGDMIAIPLITHSGSNTGVAVVATATDLILRYGSAANTFIVHNFGTGATTGITNTNWALVLHAVYWS